MIGSITVGNNIPEPGVDRLNFYLGEDLNGNG